MSTIIISLSLLLILYFYIQLAVKLNIIDKPNERSSHTSPTVRGAGIIFIIALIVSAFYDSFQYKWFLLGIIFAGIISFTDDIKSLPRSVRIVSHLIAIISLAYQLNLIYLGFWLIPLIILFIGIINAYNFMDGINGITSFYSLSIFIPFLLTETNDNLKNLIYIICISLAIFTYFNARKKALCFMGDIGSISLALIVLFVVLNRIIETNNFYLIFSLLLYGIDSIFTIIQRLYNKENIFKAHRKHLFQYLANEYKLPHLLVSLIYALIQLVINLYLVYYNTNLLVMITILIAFSVTYIIIKARLISHNDSEFTEVQIN